MTYNKQPQPEAWQVYEKLLMPGEVFWKHGRLTIIELLWFIQMRNSVGTPKCEWETIRDINATSAATLWALAERFLDTHYTGVKCLSQPPTSFMRWVLDGFLKQNTINLSHLITQKEAQP